jgi:hypothetical protein
MKPTTKSLGAGRRIEKVFLALMLIWGLLFHGHRAAIPDALAMAAILMGVVAQDRPHGNAQPDLETAQSADRSLPVHRVVPIVLILALMLVTSQALIGQMAVYLVNASWKTACAPGISS